mgnify:CR=1 FL=1
MITRTEYANFGRPEDLLRYMQVENIEVVTCLTVLALSHEPKDRK